MFCRPKMFGKGKEPKTSTLVAERVSTMQDELGEPEYVDLDPDRSQPIDIYAFGRNFVEECDEDAEDDEGYVLVTSGMSDFLMPVPGDNEDDSPAAELVWYVREMNPEYFHNLRWLARLPRVDSMWHGFGRTIPMAEPPLSFSAFCSFMLLPSIIGTDSELFSHLTHEGHPVATLVVHMLSPQEHALVQTDDGLNDFLDRLDEHDYPLIFDPRRASIV